MSYHKKLPKKLLNSIKLLYITRYAICDIEAYSNLETDSDFYHYQNISLANSTVQLHGVVNA